MKRSAYWVRTYDDSITKWYSNYKSAYNFCRKLIAQEKWCGIYQWSEEKQEMICIIGC